MRDKNVLAIAMGALLLTLCLVFLIVTLTDAATLQIDDVLKAFIKENYPWAEVDIADIILSDEPSTGQPERILVEKGLPNKTVFVLEYKDGKRITASANVRTFDWAVMTRRAFKKGYMLQKEDVYTALMESSRIPKDAIRVGDQVVGTVMSRSVMGNVPLVAVMVQESQLLKRGRRVMIVAEAEGFSIFAKGELRENSRVGHDVKVVNLDSKKIIVGRLINENTVKVVF
ncbi:MAG: flagellar basal body P-ring formation protein FlgA [Nitrospirae bacterium]|nr:flagellar basal body P-ring formation protein FlgA [Nitrospirota bacterium]